MTNVELLEAAGWSVTDGWWCNPKLDNEGVFQVDELEGLTTERLLTRISVSAHNHGWRSGQQNIRESVAQKLQKWSKDVLNT